MSNLTNSIWGDDWNQLRPLWTLDPEVIFLNHGSFGATPVSVLEEQRRWQDRLERQPVKFLDRELAGLLTEALQPIAAFLGCAPESLSFTRNATTAVNSVVKSLRFNPGDEMIVADHGYPAVIRTMERVCERTGAKLVKANLPFPVREHAELVHAFTEAMTDRTRFVVVDHITSPTAMVLPIEEIIAECRKRDILCMVDAAHTPGMLPVNLDALQPDFWTGNFHKWVCSPKGAAGVYVRPGLEDYVVPAVTSHLFPVGFPREFFWTGTDDPTAWLTVPAALSFMNDLDWDRVRKHNHDLAQFGRNAVAEALGYGEDDLPVPDSPEWYGSMAVVPLPESVPGTTVAEAKVFQAKLYEHARIEVPIVPVYGRAHVRLSAQVYNAPAEYEALGKAVRELTSS